jgi:phosphoribosylanthranilate isomerase
VDEVAFGDLRDLRASLPDVRLVQVIHVAGPESVATARAVAPLVDALLLDSGNPALPVKQLGGTGRTHDWSVSRAIREAVGIPVWLAGGLGSHNVAAAIAAVRPHGVDVCSGLRTKGALDEAKVTAFFEAVTGTGTR